MVGAEYPAPVIRGLSRERTGFVKAIQVLKCNGEVAERLERFRIVGAEHPAAVVQAMAQDWFAQVGLASVEQESAQIAGGLQRVGVLDSENAPAGIQRSAEERFGVVEFFAVFPSQGQFVLGEKCVRMVGPQDPAPQTKGRLELRRGFGVAAKCVIGVAQRRADVGLDPRLTGKRRRDARDSKVDRFTHRDIFAHAPFLTRRARGGQDVFVKETVDRPGLGRRAHGPLLLILGSTLFGLQIRPALLEQGRDAEQGDDGCEQNAAVLLTSVRWRRPQRAARTAQGSR